MAEDQQMLIEHQRTWNGFCTLIKWSSVLITLTLIFLGLVVY